MRLGSVVSGWRGVTDATSCFHPGWFLDRLRTGLVAQIQIRNLDLLQTRIGQLASPRDMGEPLAGSKSGNCWKYRVGDWRIICDLQDHRIIVRVLRVGNRREVYG